MAIKPYFCKKTNKSYFRVYVNKQSSKYPHIREQKLIKNIPLDSPEKAQQLNDEWTVICKKNVELREAQGCCWDELINRFEAHYKKYPTRKMNLNTISDHVARVKNYTKSWLKKPCGQIVFADGCELFENLQDKGLSITHRRNIKGSINKIYKWGLKRRYILDTTESPVIGVEIEELHDLSEEVEQEILTDSEIHLLLKRAFETKHPWANIWKLCLYTGLRSQELNGLRKEDIFLIKPSHASSLEADTKKKDIKYGHIKVKRQWKTKTKKCGRLKGKYSRTIPLNSSLYWWLIEYLPNASFGRDSFGSRVFPKLKNFDNGNQAQVLRTFCAAERLKSVKFHTLRACWATQVLRSGTSSTDLMLMGGWRDYSTMMIYIRLAGLETVGATEGLDFESLETRPNKSMNAAEWTKLNREKRESKSALDNVVSLFG